MSLKYQYQNIDSNIEAGTPPPRMTPLSIESPSRKESDDKSGSSKIFKVVAFGLFLTGALFMMNFQPSNEVLGADAPADDATTSTATTEGFCCHFAPDKSDTCGTCLARQTTGSCAADLVSCGKCGGTFCGDDASSPAPLTTTEPGICCHYATDASDICGTCLAPDDSSCGATPAACAACGGGKNSGWCASASAPSSNQVNDDHVAAAADTAAKDVDTVSDTVNDAKDTAAKDVDTVSDNVNDAKDTAAKDVDTVSDAADGAEVKDAEDTAAKDVDTVTDAADGAEVKDAEDTAAKDVDTVSDTVNDAKDSAAKDVDAVTDTDTPSTA